LGAIRSEESLTAANSPDGFFQKPCDDRLYTLTKRGTHIAFMMPWERRLNVFVRKVDEN
jgi:hypothetical protein